jgi:hypothetical protein
MKELTTGQASMNDALFELGKVLGQGVAFGTIAGRCSAAQAAAIRKVRNEKGHLHFKLTWNEFCPKHLKMSGSQADTFIRLLEEFGPEYFEHTQTVRISADLYRLVAPFFVDRALHFEGEVLELNSANVQKVARTVRESQLALLPPAEVSAEVPHVSVSDRLAALDLRVKETVAEFREVARSVREAGRPVLSESMFRGAFIRLSSEMKRVALENGIV